MHELMTTQLTAYLIALDAAIAGREFPLKGVPLVIGRSGGRCDIIVSGPTVSRQHARLEPVPGGDGGYRIVDLQSLNGVYVNGRKVQGQVVLAAGDIIGLGLSEAHHLRFQLNSSRQGSWSSTLPPQPSWSIGRAGSCDISLPYQSMVSSRHATVRMSNGGLEIHDQNSLNGTWVNGLRIRRKRALREQDTVTVGSANLHFTLLPDGRLEVVRRECSEDVQVECVHVDYEVRIGRKRSKKLLEEITLSLKPGEFVGILGPSGAGKSTLLKVMNGYLAPSSGQVLFNETPLYQGQGMFRGAIGYVPQDDILHQELSVEKSLDYVARLRLPPDLTRAQRYALIDATLEALGLNPVRNQLISSLSGGQRKRVSIAAELLTKPSVLFLDEPTSGLDPSVEEKIMRHFKKMAHEGTTVLITTHILYSLHMLDRVIILSQGRLVFFGTPDEAMDFFQEKGTKISRPTQMFDILEQVGDTDTKNTMNEVVKRKETALRYCHKYRLSPLYQKNILDEQTDQARRVAIAFTGETEAGTVKAGTGVVRSAPLLELLDLFPLRDFLTLTQRQFNLRIGSLRKVALYCLIPLLLALVTISQQAPEWIDDAHHLAKKDAYSRELAGLPAPVEDKVKALLAPAAGKEEDRSLAEMLFALRYEGVQSLPVPMSVMVMCVMTALFLGAINTCLEISTERTIFQRERMSGLRLADYLFSKLPVVFLVTLLQCHLFLLFLFLKPDYRYLHLFAAGPVMTLTAWTSAIMGLVVSSLDSSRGQMSVIFAIAVVLPQLILSGGLGPDYYLGLNKVVQGVADCLPARWGLEMLFSALYPDGSELALQWLPDFVRNTIGLEFGTQAALRGVYVLMLQSGVFLMLAALFIKRQDRMP